MPASPRKSDPEAILQKLEWTVLRRLDGLLQGDYRTLFRGFGMDLAELREYQYGDEVRHIDWNVTARLQTPYVREYHEERDLCHRNRVGAMLYAASVDDVIPPRSGRRHVLFLLHRMMSRPAPRRAGETHLGELLRAALGMLGRRSLVFVVSDFISAPGWEKPLAHLARRHEVLAVPVRDPLERELPDLGALTLEDAETGEQLFVDTHDKGFRERFSTLSFERESRLREVFAQAGVDALELSTDDDLAAALARFAALRKRRIRNDLPVA